MKPSTFPSPQVLRISSLATIALVILLTSLVLVVPAAAQDGPSGQLTVFMWGGPPDIDTYEAAIARYMGLYPDVEIELIDAAGCGASYAACKTLIAGGTMADVFVPGSWNYNAMANDGVLEDLGPLIDADMDLDLADFHPVTIEAVTSLQDGIVVGLPMGFNIQSMWFNKDMFDAAGLDYPPTDGDYTWDDVSAWAKQLTIDENGNTADSMDFDPGKIVQWGYYNHFVWPWGNGYDPILFSFGGSTMTLPDRQSCNLEHPDSVRAWQFIQDLMWTDHSTVKPDAHAEQIGFLRWVGGQVALQHGSFEQAKLVDDQNPGLNYDIAPLPKGDAGNATVIQVHMWSIYSGSPNKELAWHLLRWLATEGSVGDYGSIMTLIPAYKDFALGEYFVDASYAPEHTKEAQLDPLEWELTTYPSMYNERTDQIQGSDGFGDALTKILNNKASAADALSGICARVDGVMQE
jgi:multiple sugar transport system substrate-binding protein